MIWGIVVAMAIILACNGLGSVTALALTGSDPKHRPRSADRFTCFYYACAVGALTAVIW